MNEKEQRHILFNYIIYFITFIILCCIGIRSTFAISITDSNYATKYYWYVANDNTSTTSTAYRTGSDNKLTLYGATAPTYDNGEGFNGFYNRINYSITKGSIYTLSLTINYNGLLDGEFNTSHINNRLLTTDYVHCSDCTVTAVSGSTRRYNSTSPIGNLYDYVVQMSYTFIATSSASEWYIGTYTGSDRTLGVDNHTYTAIIIVNNLEISNDNSSTIINQNDTIINQNQQMIEQNQQNTQDIINNQNQNTQDIINSTKACSIIDNTNINKGGFIQSNGDENTTDWSKTYYGITDYIKIDDSTTITPLNIQDNNTASYCFYNVNKVKLSCYTNNTMVVNTNLTIPSNASFVRFSIYKSTNAPQLNICKNGSQATTDAVNDLNDSLNDDDTTGATSEASDFFSDFTTNTFGLTSIITAPLNLIQSLTSSTCTQLHLPLPYLTGQYLDLPCMSTIYSQYFGTFFTIYQTITYGIIAYWVCVRIFNQVKDFKNPEHDEIEVVDL